MLLGLAVVCWRTAHRWLSRANPRSPWKRRPRSREFLVRVRGVGLVALHAGDRLRDAVGGEQLAVEDPEGGALLPGPFQGLVQLRGLHGEGLGALVDVPVGGGAGDAVVAAELLDAGAVAEP